MPGKSRIWISMNSVFFSPAANTMQSRSELKGNKKYYTFAGSAEKSFVKKKTKNSLQFRNQVFAKKETDYAVFFCQIKKTFLFNIHQ